VRVCKKAFLRIHGISNGRLDRALRAQIKNGGSPHNDQRGRHPPANKTNEADMALIKEHIQSFPQYQSHYSRASNPHRKYLSPQLTISKMYVLYKVSGCIGMSSTKASVSHLDRVNINTSHTHSHIFDVTHTHIHDTCTTLCIHAHTWPLTQTHIHTHTCALSHTIHTHALSHTHTFTHAISHTHALSHTRAISHTHALSDKHILTLSLSLNLSHTHTHTRTHAHTQTHSPKSDTCKVCDNYKVQTDAESDDSKKAILMGEWDLHKAKAERAYQQLKEDSALSRSRSDLEVLTFDLEQSLPTPVLTTNVAFYKRQLWTYNVGIHNCKTGGACMHMFHEGIASRGSHEIGSCLLKHLREMNTDAKHLILYSDSCGGQNRNIFIVCLLLHIVCSQEFTISLIDHKFMVSGHSYLPNDRDFGSVETARRRTQHL